MNVFIRNILIILTLISAIPNIFIFAKNQMIIDSYNNYSSGVNSINVGYSQNGYGFINTDIVFTSGLKLVFAMPSPTINNYGVIAVFNHDNSLYMSYVDTCLGLQYSNYLNNFDIKFSKWDSVLAFNGEYYGMDTLLWNEGGRKFHMVFNIEEPASPKPANVEVVTGFDNIVISKDSMGNYIKWQISKVYSSILWKDDDGIEDNINVIDSIEFKWAKDSCGNGIFKPEDTPLIDNISKSQESPCLNWKIVNQQLVFSNIGNVEIVLYKVNGQYLKNNNGYSNYIHIKDLSEGLYICFLKNEKFSRRLKLLLK